MRTRLDYYLVALLMIGFFLSGCDEEGEMPIASEVEEQIEGNGSPERGVTDQMYFPPSGIDEWETVAPSTLAWDSAGLAGALEFAREKNSYSLVILHKGRIVAEEYWKGTGSTSQHDLESVSKSLTAFVIGVLQQDGKIKIEDKVSSYLPEGWSNSAASESEITLRHLLTMTSGLNEELKWVGPPGETWRYSDAAYRKLYDVIEAATGNSFTEVFETVLFNPLGMTGHSWNGKDLLTSARDIARFGLLIMNDGVWKGHGVIQDEGYFSDMLSSSQTIHEAYGYLWWLNGKNTWFDDDKVETNQGPIAATMPSDAVLAKGKRDQRIYVVPSLDLVVVRQGGDTMLP